jgi:hypothetical protein
VRRPRTRSLRAGNRLQVRPRYFAHITKSPRGLFFVLNLLGGSLDGGIGRRESRNASRNE